jgi:adenylate kinase family enzyme
MDLKTAILIGPSGCGKGTQAKLLVDYLEKNDSSRKTAYLQSGEKFREVMQGDSYIQKRLKDIVSSGGLSPTFMAIWVWASMFIEKVEGDEHLIIDGFPRKADESPILHTAFEFLGREKPVVISFELEDDVIIKRLVEGRKRADDTEEGVAKRLKWFRRNVSLAIKFFEEHSYYTVVHVNGDQSPEDVHRDILDALGL